MKLAKFVIVILTIMSCFMTFSIYNSAKATETNAGGFVSSSNSTTTNTEVVQTMTSVGEVTSGQNAGFGLQESLNTIIIAVGVIIILLSIAILVRLKQY